MEEGVKKYSPLGEKTLFMLIVKRSIVVVLLMPGFIVGLMVLDYVSSDYFSIALSLVYAYCALLFIFLIWTFFWGWLEYQRYGIELDREDIKIRRGLIAIEETGIPYRRIKDVKIHRSLIDQIFGMSDIVITILDSDMNIGKKEPVLYLPSLERHIAREIQENILNRAQVEQIHVMGPRSPQQSL